MLFMLLAAILCVQVFSSDEETQWVYNEYILRLDTLRYTFATSIIVVFLSMGYDLWKDRD